MSATQIVTEIVNILVSGLTSMATGIGEGLASAASAMAFSGTGESQTLSVWFIMILVFAGISLAIGLTRLVYNFLASLGGSH